MAERGHMQAYARILWMIWIVILTVYLHYFQFQMQKNLSALFRLRREYVVC